MFDVKLVLNIAHKSFLELLSPLDPKQVAPVPLLWLYRVVFLWGGGGELSMRAFSLITSILAMVLFYLLARRVLKEPRAVLLVTWLLALAPGVILFAAMVKQYSLDLLVAVGLLYLAAPWFTSPSAPRRIWGLSLAAGLAPWFSLPAIFVSGGLGAGLLWQSRQRGFLPALVFLSTVGLSFALEYFIFLKHSFNTLNTLHHLMRVDCLQFTNKWWKLSLAHIFFSYLGPYSNKFTLILVLSGLVILGLWAAAREYGWSWGLALILPLFLAFAASAAQFFPISGRFLLFSTTATYLLLGYGASFLFRLIPWPRLLGIGLILLIFPCLKASVALYGKPVGGVREALQYMAANWQPQDLVFFDTYSAPSIAYYRLLGRPGAGTLSFGLDVEKWIEGRVGWPDKLSPEEVWPLIPAGRQVWLVAETLDYSRGPATGILPYFEEMTQRLHGERELTTWYVTPRVQVRRFSPRPSPIISWPSGQNGGGGWTHGGRWGSGKGW